MLPTYKKVCVYLAHKGTILDLSTGFLVWLLVQPKSTRRVTLAAPLLQACSSLAVTPVALHLLLPAQARNHSYHSTGTRQCACLLYVFGARPLTVFVSLADHRGTSNN